MMRNSNSVFKRSSVWMSTMALALLLAACGQNATPEADQTRDDLTLNAIDDRYTIEATGDNVARVVWSVDGAEVETDAEAPFLLELDLADYEPGEHQIHARITIDVLDERSDVQRTVDFTVGGDGGNIGWTLVDADTDQDVAAFESGDTVGMDDPTAASARLEGVPGPVTFYLDGNRTRRESSEPYALFGDANGDYHAGDLGGTHTLRAVAGDGSEHVATVTVVSGEVDDGDSGSDGSGDGDDGSDGSDGSDGDTVSPPEGDAVPRLLSGWGWKKNDTLQIDEFAYRPNDVGSGEFEGFDRLYTRRVDARGFRFRLDLTRDATVVMAWPASDL